MLPVSNKINHIGFIIDDSGSMSEGGKEQAVVQIVDQQVKLLADRSVKMDQETRVTVYFFGGRGIRCIISDKDVLRLPSLKGLYDPHGCTPLIDAACLAIDDFKQIFTKYGDHSNMLWLLTDGMNTSSTIQPWVLTQKVNALPDNWTLAALVPDKQGISQCVKWGFPSENIRVWNSVNADGVKEVGKEMEAANERYMQLRATGARGTKNLYSMDTSHLTKTEVKGVLEELRQGVDYDMYPVHGKFTDKIRIDAYTEACTKQPYRTGSVYYQLNKPETIQEDKQICYQEKRGGKVYTGSQARAFLKLPDYAVKVKPEENKDYWIFVQSNAPNRHLIAGTKIIVMR